MPSATKTIARRQRELRGRLWPNLRDGWLWSRHSHAGFTTIPRCMPLLGSIMDDLANGKPVFGTYLELWCRAFDEGFVTLARSRELAFHAGFTGQRAEQTWRGRLKILAELGFIDVKPGPSGPMSYALIKNPYLVVKKLRAEGHPGVREDKYHALLERTGEIKETSLDDEVPASLEMSAAEAAERAADEGVV